MYIDAVLLKNTYMYAYYTNDSESLYMLLIHMWQRSGPTLWIIMKEICLEHKVMIINVIGSDCCYGSVK